MKRSELRQIIKEELEKFMINKGTILKKEGIPFFINKNTEILATSGNAKIMNIDEASNEKTWIKMSKEERLKAYKVAIKSGDVKDTFSGFSKMMDSGSIFNTKTGKPIEISWK